MTAIMEEEAAEALKSKWMDVSSPWLRRRPKCLAALTAVGSPGSPGLAFHPQPPPAREALLSPHSLQPKRFQKHSQKRALEDKWSLCPLPSAFM